jgi:hypothetical protein
MFTTFNIIYMLNDPKYIYFIFRPMLIFVWKKERFKDTKGVIRSRKSKKNR